MILVHRLKGAALLINPDLIESVEVIPDTVITLVDGRKAIVRESPSELVRLIRDFRASVLVRADELGGSPPAHLSLVEPREED